MVFFGKEVPFISVNLASKLKFLSIYIHKRGDTRSTQISFSSFSKTWHCIKKIESLFLIETTQ